MRTRGKRPVLYGPDGRELALGVYPSTRSRPTAYRPRPNLSRDTRRNVTAADRKELVNTSRILFGQVGNLGSAIIDKNFWAFGDGWDPHYTGQNEAWGVEATSFLRNQFYPNCDLRARFDFTTCLFLSGVAWDRDGDDLMILTEDGGGFPKLEFIPATRIGNSEDVQSGQVVGGRYDGYQIVDGIIFDEGGTPVAARVLGLDPDRNDVYQDYALGYGGNADLAYPPEWQDQGRGIPLVGRSSLDWLDKQDIDEFLKRGIKRASSVGLVTKNAEGQAPVGNEIVVEEETTDSAGATRTLVYEEVEGGEMYYLKSGTGEAMEGIKYETPHPNVEKFIARIERGGLRAIGWSYELVYLAESGRAATRLVCKLGNNSIWRQQKLGLRRTWRAVRYALAKAMKNGFLSRNPDPRDAYFSWDFGLPAELSVDEGNDEQSDRENLKIGTTTKARIAQRKGEYWLENNRQRKKEIIQNARDAEEIEATTAGKVSFDRALDLMEQRQPNLIVPPAPKGANSQDASAKRKT